MTNETVSLNFNTEALKKSLRFAFANDTTVLSELVQNARRAGATKVWITTATGQDGVGQISVLNNGKGLENFQVLLSVATSGWDEEVTKNEGPYGLGFLSCLYAGTHVDVVSQGKILRIDQEGALSDEVFHVERFEGELANGATTSVTIYGVNLEKIKNVSGTMFRGYPIEIEFDGNVIARHDAADDSFIDTEVGKIKCASEAYEDESFRVYLQGFLVLSKSKSYFSREQDVVHLDPKKYFGKFPDRDVVINENEMIQDVIRARREIYRDMVLKAKETMKPLDFMNRYHKMARGLRMLEVFNDIDIVPQSFLAEITEMPHEVAHWLDCHYLSKGDSDKVFTRKEIEDGDIVVAELERFEAEGDGDHALRWIYAYGAKAWTLEESLDAGHWLYDHLKIHDDTDVNVRVIGQGKHGELDPLRSNCLGAANVTICDDVELTANAMPVLIGEPFYWQEDNCLLVPLANGKPMEVSSGVIHQMNSYIWGDQYREEEQLEDQMNVNSMIRELFADSLEESVALSLTAALTDFQTIRDMVCTFSVDARGNVKVHAVAKSASEEKAVVPI